MKTKTFLLASILTTGVAMAHDCQTTNVNYYSQKNVSVQQATSVESAIANAMTLAEWMRDELPALQYHQTFESVMVNATIANDTVRDLGSWAQESRDAVLDLIADLESKEDLIQEFLVTPAKKDFARKLMSSLRVLKRQLQ